MSSGVWSDLRRHVLDRCVMTEADLRVIGSDAFWRGASDWDAAESLMSMHQGAEAKPSAWPDLFSRLMCDCVARLVESENGFSDRITAMLFKGLSDGSRLVDSVALDVLIDVLERIPHHSMPLVLLGLSEVKTGILTGQSVLREGHLGVVGVITQTDVAIMRRLLAAGGRNAPPVGRDEAFMLLEINALTDDKACDHSWNALYVSAMAHALVALCGLRVQSRGQVMSGDVSAAHPITRRTPAMDRLAIANKRTQFEVAKKFGSEQRRDAFALARDIASRIGAGHVLRGNEAHLLAALEDSCPVLPPALQTLVDTAA